MRDRLADMLLAQYDQQTAFLLHRVYDDTERAKLSLELAFGAIEEINEYVALTDYKTLLPRGSRMKDRRSARKYQIIDLLKYTLALAHLDDFTADELYETFMSKTDTVRLRYREELDALRVASFDIDGVICDLAGAGFDGSGSEADKAAFFDTGGAVHCKPVTGAQQLLYRLQRDGWGIVLITTRKRHWHPTLESQTYAWLSSWSMPFDRVIFSQSKADALIDSRLPIGFHVEDSAKHALDVASAGIRTFYVGPAQVEHPLIIRADGIDAVAEALVELEQAV